MCVQPASGLGQRRRACLFSVGAPFPRFLHFHRTPQVSHILLGPEQKQLLPQLRGKVEAGEATLAALAPEHSQCPSER